MTHDRFGNPLDPSVGYARGPILSSSAAEIRRLRHAQSIAAQVVAERGIEAIAIFTGNPRYFPVKPNDLSELCEEWVGPGLFADEMTEAATMPALVRFVMATVSPPPKCWVAAS
ncbi:MAG: hypothetical protein AAFN59_13315, partial [Pseudomonadota bacterium]